MMIAAWTVLIFVIVLVVCQSLAVTRFVSVLRSYCGIAETQTSLPKAAVVLSLRGPDPFLGDTLAGLVAQDYPDFLVHIVVDSEQDPGWKDIQRVRERIDMRRVRCSVLRNPRPTCSLKCSALIEAVEALADDFEVIAFIDGDAPPDPGWLRRLVGPLADSHVGVATGNRWFMPERSNWGSLVRYFWNTGAVVQVWLNKIVWAGSMAMRTEVIHRVDLAQAWSQALSVDATVYRQMRGHGLEVQFVPGVMMANRECIGLRQFVRWVQRQLIAAKSCGAGWRLVALHALSLVATQVIALGLCLGGIALGQPVVAVLALLTMVLYWGSCLACVLATETAVGRNIRINGGQTAWMTGQTRRRFFPALVLTHFAYAVALCGAYFRNVISWRGVEYRIHGPKQVTMQNYHPYEEPTGVPEAESVV